MPVSRYLVAPLLATAALAATGCKSPGPKVHPNFEAILSADGDAPEATLVSELRRRAEILTIPSEIDPGPAGDRKITLRLRAKDESEAHGSLAALCQSGHLTVRAVHDRTVYLTDVARTDPSKIPADCDLLTYSFPREDGTIHTENLVVHRPIIVQSADIERARPEASEDGVIHITLSPKGGQKMIAATKTMQKGRSRLAIILDDRIISAPVVGGVLSSQFIIQGFNSFEETKAVAAALTKPLSAKLRVESLMPLAPQPAKH